MRERGIKRVLLLLSKLSQRFFFPFSLGVHRREHVLLELALDVARLQVVAHVQVRAAVEVGAELRVAAEAGGGLPEHLGRVAGLFFV